MSNQYAKAAFPRREKADNRPVYAKAAFPCNEINDYHHPTGSGIRHTPADNGMSLRDYFAAKAMAAIFTDSLSQTRESIAIAAYKMADAMIEHRDSSQNPEDKK